MKPLRRFLLYVFVVGTVLGKLGVDGSADMKNLLHNLLDNLNTLERPVQNDTHDTLTVKIGLTLMSLGEVDLQSSAVRLVMWLNLEWNAYNLRWTPSEYGNITDIRLPPSKIWMPDLYVYNNVGDTFDNFHPTQVVVKSDGNVSYIPPGNTKIQCKFEFEKYPFETFQCDIKFGSWVHHGFQLDIELQDEEADISSFTSSHEWKLLSANASKTTNYYMCCPEPYVDVVYKIRFQSQGEEILTSVKSGIFLVYGLLLMSLLLDPYTAIKTLLAAVSMAFSFHESIGINPGSSQWTELEIYFNWLNILTGLVVLCNLVTYYMYYKLGSPPFLIRKWIHHPIVKKLLLPAGKLTPSVEMTGNVQGFDEDTIQHERLGAPNVTRDWQLLSFAMDRIAFWWWVVFLFCYHIICFPSFDGVPES